MSFRIIPALYFEKEAKRIGKRHRSFKADLIELVAALQINPIQGTKIAPDVYKIRMAIKSKGRGKSGGARIFSYLFIKHEELYLIGIIDKGDTDNIPDHITKARIEEVRDALD